ncbi:hypothetical protein ACQCSU_12180 [Pseudarthrobacter sp. O4]|uniref:hypothetical protein n=1 Tax=Pseudarthrobacter sp. O4 TaxID=3418417 RepID=UPI003CF2C190
MALSCQPGCGTGAGGRLGGLGYFVRDLVEELAPLMTELSAGARCLHRGAGVSAATRRVPAAPL